MSTVIPFHLETPRLVLRPFDDQDIRPFSAYRSDPEVARYQGWEAPYSIEQAVEFIAAMKNTLPGQPGAWYQIAIGLKPAGSIIGDCAFIILEEDPRQAEIAFTLAPAYQGQGYATEAVSCLLNFLFADLNLHRVRANCDPDNQGSARLLKRIGMRFEGRFVESLWLKGEWVSEDWYAILQRKWLEKVGHPSG